MAAGAVAESGVGVGVGSDVPVADYVLAGAAVGLAAGLAARFVGSFGRLR